SLPAGVLTAGLSSQADAALPSTLVGATVQMALAFSTGKTMTAGAALSIPVITLAKGVIRTMSLTKKMTVALALLVTAAASTGAATFIAQRTSKSSATSPPVPKLPRATLAQRSKSTPKDDSSPMVLSPGREAIRQALIAAKATTNPSEKAESLWKIGLAQSRQGDRDGAKETLQLAAETASVLPLPPDITWIIPHVLIRIAEAQAAIGDGKAAHRTFQRAIPVIQSMEKDDQETFWINFIPTQVATEGRDASRESIEAYRQYLKTNQDRDTSSNLSELFGLEAQEQSVDQALQDVLHSEEARGPNGAEFKRNALISIVKSLKAEDREVAGPVLTEARAAVDTGGDPKSGYRPGRVAELEAIAKAQARLARFQDAIATTKAITAGRLSVRRADMAKFHQAGCFLDIAEMQLESGDNPGARDSARLALQTVGTIQIPGGKPVPLSRVVRILARAGDLQGLMETVEFWKNAVNGHTDDIFTYSLLHVASAQQKAGDQASGQKTLEQALELAESLLRKAENPANPAANEAFATDAFLNRTRLVAEIQARMGNMPAALRTIDQLKTEDSRQNAWITLAASRASRGDLESALTLISKITSPELKREAWIRIASDLPAVSHP
ncbi:hypothetical protein ACYOEI_13655, partial [Singulisphaera rosea]